MGMRPQSLSITKRAGIDGDQFKNVMRRFAAGVCVITSRDRDVLNGMTATAVCSVTVDPPAILIIVNQATRTHALISNSKIFAVNLLSADQRNLAQHFASKPAVPFRDVEHSIGVTGCPIISDADANLECAVEKAVDWETHTIFVGQVVACSSRKMRPLVYHDGRYCSLPETSEVLA